PGSRRTCSTSTRRRSSATCRRTSHSRRYGWPAKRIASARRFCCERWKRTPRAAAACAARIAARSRPPISISAGTAARRYSRAVIPSASEGPAVKAQVPRTQERCPRNDKLKISGPPIARHVKEHRRREYNRIEPVEHAAVTFDQVAPILDAAITFDRRHDQPAEESHHSDQ